MARPVIDNAYGLPMRDYPSLVRSPTFQNSDWEFEGNPQINSFIFSGKLTGFTKIKL